MREILFRGKKKNNGEWIYGDLSICDDCDPTIYDTQTGNRRFRVGSCVLLETVGQFTGLTDKNVKKIFEGDIIDVIRFGERIRYVVSFSEDRCGWYPFACGDGCGCCESDVISPERCEVIGNIHDNPELLKGADDERNS